MFDVEIYGKQGEWSIYSSICMDTFGFFVGICYNLLTGFKTLLLLYVLSIIVDKHELPLKNYYIAIHRAVSGAIATLMNTSESGDS